jgi:Uma2 family endonuclease
MTAVQEPVMTSGEFEDIARYSERVAEGLRLEFIDGRVGVKAMPDGDHGRILQWLLRILLALRPELFLHYDQGLRIDRYRNGRARPDAVIATADAFVGSPEWADPGTVMAAVEVTSFDHDTDRRDRRDKPRAYAETGIPIYLLIDRDSCELTVFTQPDGGRYQSKLTVPFGATVHLPAPVGIDLDTEPLKGWVS